MTAYPVRRNTLLLSATLTCLSYIALCHDLRASEAYLALKSLRELP